jgi:hypothetical protein
MDSVMEHFLNPWVSPASSCHVGDDSTDNWDFAADDNKHKLVARNMMKMTRQDQ